MALLTPDKTNLRELRKLVNDIANRYPEPGLFSPSGSGCHVIANDGRTYGASIKLDCFMGDNHVIIREWRRFINDKGQPDLTDTRNKRYNITTSNYIKMRTLLREAFHAVNN